MRVFTVHKNENERHGIMEGEDIKDVLKSLIELDLSDCYEITIRETEFYFIRDEDL